MLRQAAVHREVETAEHPTVRVPHPLDADRPISTTDATLHGAEDLARRGDQDDQVVQEGLTRLAQLGSDGVI